MDRCCVRLPAAAVLIVMLCGSGCSQESVAPGQPVSSATLPTREDVPRQELRLATDDTEVVKGARTLMEADEAVALITVDTAGRPRVRTVRFSLEPAEPSGSASSFTVWVKTRLTTRKIDQLRANPHVTLYFNDDENESYASVMGTAVIHTNPDHPPARPHYTADDVKIYWPQFPRDFVMLEIRPRWLEYVGANVSNDNETWRPQAVVFD